MSNSNDASGTSPDASAAELAAVEKKSAPTRARKSPAPAKKTAPAESEPKKPAAKKPTASKAAPKTTAKSASKKNVKAENEVPAAIEAPSAPVAEAAPKKSVKAPGARKAAPKKAPAKAEADASPAPAAEAPQVETASVEEAEPAKKAPARKKAAPKKTAPVAEVPLESAASAASGPEPSPVAEPGPEAGAAEAQQTEKTSSSRRRRGSRGRGRKKDETAQAAQEGTEPVLALEGQEAKALPAPPQQLALEGQEAQPALESAEAQKKSRRRKRGKGNGNGNGNGEAVRTESAEAAKTAEDAPARAGRAVSKRKRKMFVNVLSGEQVEVVVSEEGQIREYYVEMLHQAKIKGNIYKGVIHNLDPNLQAAFVSYGAVKNGFLQIDEVHPEYYLTPHEQGKGHKYPLIQKVLKAGQEILVQVVKEPSGTKGAFLTSYLSIPGRYLVLTPGREQIGVSRKVGSDAERGRLREVLNSLSPGEGLGVIVRTVSEGASKTNLQRDLQMLKRVWRDVRKKGSTEEAPALIYQELGLAARAVRDYLTDDVTELWVNDQVMADEISEVIAMMFPKRKDILQVHDDSGQSLFERFGLARQIAQVQSREVVLPSGGRLVFDQTEALMAIDINSGRTGGKSNFEDMAFKINLEAAQNIPLQLRLRDIGGQVVVDFIEMRDRSHWREVEKTFRNGMKEDRARHDVGKISSFGLLEVVRQRLGSSAISIASEPCPFCKGTGVRRNMEWQALQAMQEIQQLIRQNNDPGKTIIYSGSGELVLYLLNSKKEWLLDIEQENNVKLELRPGI